MTSTDINSIPDELLTEILVWISPRKVFKFLQVSRRLKFLLSTNHFASLSVALHRAELESLESKPFSFNMTRIYNEVGPKRTFKYWIEFLTFRMVFMKSPPAFQWACVRKLSFLDTHFRFRDVEVDSDHELVPPATHWQIVLSNVTGTIPKEIGKLDGLLVVKLGNSLSGPIPDEFGNLIHLRMLDLGSNRLSGPLPGVFASLRSLKMLVLSNNRLTGSIPSWIGNLTALVDLWLDGNQFSGEIPGSVGKLTSLEFFNVRDNNLSGEIPPEMQQLKALDVLWAYGNAGLTCSFHFPQLRVGVNE